MWQAFYPQIKGTVCECDCSYVPVKFGLLDILQNLIIDSMMSIVSRGGIDDDLDFESD